MSSSKKTTTNDPTAKLPSDFTEKEINDTFEKLGLSDPRYLEYLNRLAYPAESQQSPAFWYGADSGTSFIKSDSVDA